MRAKSIHRAIAYVAAASTLAACTPSSFDPASPDPDPTETTTSPEPTPSATQTPLESGRNPYESGATEDWALELDAEPEAVTFDRQSSVAVVVTTEGGMQRLNGYSVTSSGQTFPMWTYYLPTGTVQQGLDAANGQVYLNMTEGERLSDFIIVSARTGSEEFRWTLANPLDQDVPLVVGAYDAGVGVIKQERRAGVAAIMDSRGKVLSDRSETFYPESVDDPIVMSDLVLVDTDGAVSTFMTFPELGEISGEACRSTLDGVVCVDTVEVEQPGEADTAASDDVDPTSSDDESTSASPGAYTSTTEPSTSDPSSDGASPSANDALETQLDASPSPTSAEPSESAPASAQRQTVTEYSREGYRLRETFVDDMDPELLYRVQLDADVTARELARALEEVPSSAGTGDVILSDGDWLLADEWEVAGDVTLAPRCAPYVLAGSESEAALTNVRNGHVLNDDGTRAILGSGNASNMYFQWDGDSLTYLRPNG